MGTAETKAASSASAKLDPEYAAAVQALNMSGIERPVMKTAQDLRAFSSAVMAPALRREPWPTTEQVIETKHEITSFDGSFISVSRFQGGRGPATSSIARFRQWNDQLRCGNIQPLFRRNTKRWDVQTFAMDYSLAPESPAPGPVEDVYAALKWLSANAKDFDVDPARLIICGDSAGGGIAAGTALLARDRGLSPPLAKQILIYPMLDDRTIGRYGPDWAVREFLVWDDDSNKIAWSAYVGNDKAGKDNADLCCTGAREGAGPGWAAQDIYRHVWTGPVP